MITWVLKTRQYAHYISTYCATAVSSLFKSLLILKSFILIVLLFTVFAITGILEVQLYT